MQSLNCPNCGDALGPAFQMARMVTCTSCDTSVLLDGAKTRATGQSGDMHEVPSLFQLGQHVDVGGATYTVRGHARFDYGRGWWDEFWVKNDQSDAWISCDEGDVIFQTLVPLEEAPDFESSPALGHDFQALSETFRVTEANTATCVALRGAFPEVMMVGTKYNYANCTGSYGTLLSGEFSGGDADWYKGFWLDPFAFADVLSK